MPKKRMELEDERGARVKSDSEEAIQNVNILPSRHNNVKLHDVRPEQTHKLVKTQHYKSCYLNTFLALVSGGHIRTRDGWIGDKNATTVQCHLDSLH